MEDKTPQRKVSEEMGKRKPNVYQRIKLTCGCTLDRFHYKAVFFTCYGAFACLYTFLPLYFKQLGLSALHTGVLTGLRPLCQAIGAPFWGILADRFQQRRTILFLGSTAWLIKNMLLFVIRPMHEVCFAKPVIYRNDTSVYTSNVLVHNNTLLQPIAATSPAPFDKYKYFIQVDNAELSDIFYIYLLLVVVGELFGSIVQPLLDGCTVDFLGDERKAYGRIRLWGSVGMVSANLVAGLIINHFTYQYCGEIRKHYIIAFYIFASFMAIMLIELFYVKIVYSDAPKRESLREIKNLFNSRLKSCFWLLAVAIGISDGFQADFNSWFLDDLKATSFQVGLAAALHHFISALCFFFANYVLGVLTYNKAITLGMALYSVVFVCYSFTHSPWMALVLYAILGGVFAVIWTACVAYVGSISTAIGLGAAAQGILNGLFVGVGSGSGSIIGGLLISKVGIRATYRLFAAFLVLIILFFLACHWQGQGTDEDGDDSKSAYRAVPSQEEDLGE